MHGDLQLCLRVGSCPAPGLLAHTSCMHVMAASEIHTLCCFGAAKLLIWTYL